MDRKRKIAFHSLGCKVNSYETEAMRQSLENEGYEIVPFEQEADVYIINTCTVTNIADRKSRQMLHRAKKMNPEAVVVAVGCYVQAAGEKLLEDEAVDIVVGTNKKSEISSILEEYFKKQEKQSFLIDVSSNCGYDDMKMTTVTEHTRAFIKIQDGCNQFCTYCIIPYARGRIRSRKLEDLQQEIEQLAENGYKEIVLTGIHLSSYGKDLDNDISLADAIRCVSNVEKIERVRLGSLEPGIVTEEFVKELADNKKFCPHFHLSLQSGCEAVLKRMNRHYTPQEYLDKCTLIRKYFINPAITTDVIVGFPAETDKEFLETDEFLRKVEFAEMHIFKYSKRQGTIAAKMKYQVDEQVKTIRSNHLLELNANCHRNYIRKFSNMELEVLMEESTVIDEQTYFVGYTREYVKVAVKTEENLTNRMVIVKTKYLLNAEILLAEILKIY